jgi:hypothetical protein
VPYLGPTHGAEQYGVSGAAGSETDVGERLAVLVNADASKVVVLKLKRVAPRCSNNLEHLDRRCGHLGGRKGHTGGNARQPRGVLVAACRLIPVTTQNAVARVVQFTRITSCTLRRDSGC